MTLFKFVIVFLGCLSFTFADIYPELIIERSGWKKDPFKPFASQIIISKDPIKPDPLKSSSSDEVTDLPGLTFPLNYRHYSGYLHATLDRFLHYWFVESQRNPTTDPVVLWLNGVPGCSSLDLFLSELGPLHVSADGKSLYNNTYSWNRVANVLFLEVLAGVGFSYADKKRYSANDYTTSMDAHFALRDFFRKFPEFKKNDFYITGEGYGGIYVPTLSVRVLGDQRSNINFKGFAIGNGCLDVGNVTNSIVFFAYHYGLVGQKIWANLAQSCCNGHASQGTCNFANPDSEECRNALQQVSEIIQDNGLNIYNLYKDCAHSSESPKVSRYLFDKRTLLRLLPASSNGYMWKEVPPCTNSSHIRKWLNQSSVRAALHIPSEVQDWDMCSLDVEIGYKRHYNTMRPQLLQLINSGKLRGLIYNGDVNMACNFLGDEWFTYNLGLKNNDSWFDSREYTEVIEDFNPWKFNGQIAGFVKHFKNLSYLTVKGSGYMVPQDKPGPAFKMIDSFLSNKPY